VLKQGYIVSFNGAMKNNENDYSVTNGLISLLFFFIVRLKFTQLFILDLLRYDLEQLFAVLNSIFKLFQT